MKTHFINCVFPYGHYTETQVQVLCASCATIQVHVVQLFV